MAETLFQGFPPSIRLSVPGFEPGTTWLKVKCSTDWATRPYALDRNRTSDTRIFSPLLYQLSYQGTYLLVWTLKSKHTKLRGQDLNLRPSGYEPDELPDCSTPRYYLIIHLKYFRWWVGESGFEPLKAQLTDLQSAPFGHSGIPPESRWSDSNR